MSFVVLDTDVASVSHKGCLPDSIASQLVGHTLCVTVVTVGEMARWAEKRQWGTGARTQLVHWLGSKVILPYDANLPLATLNVKDFTDFNEHDGLTLITA